MYTHYMLYLSSHNMFCISDLLKRLDNRPHKNSYMDNSHKQKNGPKDKVE